MRSPKGQFRLLHLGNDEIGIVESGAIGVRDGISEFAALVDRAWRFGTRVTGNTTRERKLFKEYLHAFGILGNIRIDLAVCAFYRPSGNKSEI